MKRRSVFIATLLAPIVSYSAVYMTEQQACEAMFPGAKFVKKTIALKKDEIKSIEDKSGEKVRNENFNYWIDAAKNVVAVDQVLGKHEFIPYAVGLSPKGQVTGLEILEYRETYGQQVREPKWKNQFTNKDSSAPLKLNADITNISGATLSSAHVTGGVRRILKTYEIIKSRL